MELSKAHLRYLYAIYEESLAAPEVSSAVVARKLKVSKPSVVKMVDILSEKELIVKKHYGKIILTEQGRQIAQKFHEEIRLFVELIPKMGLNLTNDDLYASAYLLASTLPDKTLGIT